jgi:phosphohistidine phosphatase
MNLFLMRHCEAESGPQDDPTRQLTDTGKRQAGEMGAFMARQAGRVDLVVTSWYARSRDTATAMAAALGCERIEETPMLEPDRSAIEAIVEITVLAKLHDAVDVLVITHHPLINALIENLTGSKTDADHFHQGSIARIDTDAGTLRWLVTPAIVERDEPAVIEAALELAESMLSALGVGVDAESFAEAAKGKYVYEEILQKRVVPGASMSGPCEECEENIDAGWIDSEDVYPSGDDGPPCHPGCVCIEEYRVSRKRVKV